MQNYSTIRAAILKLLDEQHEIHGTEFLTLNMTTLNAKHCVLRQAHVLADEGHLVILQGGGRGRKTTYKRNRNSPGAPIRRHKR